MVHHIWKSYPEIENSLEEVKKIILTEQLPLHPAITEKIAAYVDAPGKYLRAGLSLLFAQMVEGGISPAKLYFAAHLETLHLATLIHDDVIDEAASRRGIEAAHTQFSNRIAIYTGDYLLAYSARLLSKGLRLLELGEGDLEGINNKLLERILQGELSQLLNQHNRQMSMKTYLKQIQGKTAFLFGYACQLGAFHPGQEVKRGRQAFRIGQAIGMAFQLRDDVIDYQLTATQSGKPVLQDLKNGIFTAPLLLAMRQDGELPSLLDLLSQEEGEEVRQTIFRRVRQTGAIQQVEGMIGAYLKKVDHRLTGLVGRTAASPMLDLLGRVFSDYF